MLPATSTGKHATGNKRGKTYNQLSSTGKLATAEESGKKFFQCQMRENMQVPTRVRKHVASVRHGIKCNQCRTRENVITAVKRGKIHVTQSRLDFDWLKV